MTEEIETIVKNPNPLTTLTEVEVEVEIREKKTAKREEVHLQAAEVDLCIFNE